MQAKVHPEGQKAKVNEEYGQPFRASNQGGSSKPNVVGEQREEPIPQGVVAPSLPISDLLSEVKMGPWSSPNLLLVGAVLQNYVGAKRRLQNPIQGAPTSASETMVFQTTKSARERGSSGEGAGGLEANACHRASTTKHTRLLQPHLSRSQGTGGRWRPIIDLSGFIIEIPNSCSQYKDE